MDQATLIVVTPGWQTQSWYPHLLQMSIKNPLLLPSIPNLLIGTNKQNHKLIEKKNLQLLAWTVSGKSYLQKDYQKCLPSLFQFPEGQGQPLIRNWPGISGIAGDLREKLIPLDALCVVQFLTECFQEGFKYNTVAGFRSAISAYHNPIQGIPVGKHPRISDLLTGIFNKNTPQPKFNFIWDIK